MPVSILLAIGAGVCFGVGEVCAKYVIGSGQIGPMTLLAVRTAFALPLVILSAWLAISWAGTEPAGWRGASPSVLAAAVIGSGVLTGALALALFYSAMRLSDITVVKPIAFGLAPVTAALVAHAAGLDRVTLPKAIGIALIVVGVVVLSSARHAKPPAHATAEPRRTPDAPG
ncbi:MAG: hypothetical protein C0475_05575 [Planctomyces sp.]|nr:hypothetical protein [Planctomyces sp.]MBA4038795.1 hypothetical protein [Planctomyces sp.]MBA4119287.1 hypothetical protein [Isosphaera sp.]